MLIILTCVVRFEISILIENRIIQASQVTTKLGISVQYFDLILKLLIKYETANES